MERMTKTASKTDAVRRFFELPQEYLARQFNIRARAYIVRKLLGEIKGKSILDLGCGDGSISRQFLADSNQLTLLDLAESMLQLARSQTPQEYLHRTKYINNEFIRCGFVAEFDVVLCLGVLAHVDSVAETIQAISAALRSDGLCVLQITDADSFQSRAMKVYCALRRAEPAECGYVTNQTTSDVVRTVAAQHDLQLVKQHRYCLPMPGMLWLSDDVLFRYQVATAESKWLSRSGSEAFFLFAKG
jgi:2-polyprenyl-3-methyl-5-hydroxy-6-metoxy-1,4-benzoquinol methylase